MVVVDPPTGGPAGQLVGSHQIDGQFVTEVVEVIVHSGDDPGDPGVVDQHVDPVEVVDGGIDQVLGPTVVGHVDADGQRVG